MAGTADDRALGHSRSRLGTTLTLNSERAFRDAFATLDRRIGLFLSLPIESLEKLAIQQQLDRIGRS